MAYTVKKIFYSLQGEGANTGRPAVFCRFAGCNLWTGREQDRVSAVCNFCDTAFVGGDRYDDADTLARTIAGTYRGSLISPQFRPLVILTGGEPLLQVDEALTRALHHWCFEVAVETNGTQAPPQGIDWMCVSPKTEHLVITTGDELKLVYPQAKIAPEMFAHLRFDRFYLQPLYGADIDSNTQQALNYCLEHPQWRLSIQTHKALGVE